MRIFFYSIVVYILLSCGHVDESVLIYKKFPKTITLSAQEHKTSPVLYFVGEMELLSNVIVTLDMKSDTIFHFFDVDSLKLIAITVTRGRGPSEEIFIDPYFRRIGNNEFISESGGCKT